MKAVRLRTEYLVNPIGIDIVASRLYWNAEGGKKQTAYQIIAKSGGKIIWNTGKVASSRMTHILYEGQSLHSREKVYWSVKLWDENGEGGEMSTGSFEMGLLENTDWKAKWITGNYKVKKSERYPVDCFRKHISITREVKSARLYITACGLYEARLDGEKIGNFCLAPGHTDYRKRVQYQTYDVTELLSVGNHTMTVQLADGWYRGGCGAWGIRNQYGTETKLLAQLEITYANAGGTRLSPTKAGTGAAMAPSALQIIKMVKWSMPTGNPDKGIGEGVFIMRRPRLIILRTCSCLCDNHLACSQSAS